MSGTIPKLQVPYLIISRFLYVLFIVMLIALGYSTLKIMMFNLVLSLMTQLFMIFCHESCSIELQNTDVIDWQELITPQIVIYLMLIS